MHFTPCIYLPVSFKWPTQYDNKKKKEEKDNYSWIKISTYLVNISITTNPIYVIYDILRLSFQIESFNLLFLLYRYRLHFISISSRISFFYTWAGYISSSFSCLPYILCYQHFSMYCLYSLFWREPTFPFSSFLWMLTYTHYPILSCQKIRFWNQSECCVVCVLGLWRRSKNKKQYLKIEELKLSYTWLKKDHL